MDTIEVHAIAAVVAAARADGHYAAGKLFGDDLGDFADSIVIGVLADVEYIAADGVFRRDERPIDGFAHILHVDERAPWTAVTHHGNPLGRPGERRQIIEHDVEAHSRRRAVRRRVAQEHRAEVGAGHAADVALDEYLAFRIRGL